MKGKAERGQYLLAVGLSLYKWYQSQAPCNVSASKDHGPRRGGGLGGPTSIGEGNECQRGCRPRREWIVIYQIGLGEEQSILYKVVETSPCFKDPKRKPERENLKRTIFPSRCFLKILKGSLRRKVQKEQYLASGGVGPLQDISFLPETMHDWERREQIL